MGRPAARAVPKTWPRIAAADDPQHAASIAESWRSRGLKRILFARADAPLAEKGPAKIAGVEIESHFGVLAEAMVAACAE